MRNFCKNLYQQLQSELQSCLQNDLPTQYLIESCFQICNLYWVVVKDEIKKNSFEDDEEEIGFFKTIKPMFVSEIEYYSFLYHSVVFEPKDYRQLITFWQWESKRLEKFENDHKSFLSCYDCANHEMEEYYFLQKYYIPNAGFETKLYDAGSRAITNGDPLVSTLLALKKYQLCANEKLLKLNRSANHLGR